MNGILMKKFSKSCKKIKENKLYCKIKNFFFDFPQSSFLNLSSNLTTDSNKTHCSSPHTYVKLNEDKDKEEVLYLNHSILFFKMKKIKIVMI